jgi:hypothetical protein
LREGRLEAGVARCTRVDLHETHCICVVLVVQETRRKKQEVKNQRKNDTSLSSDDDRDVGEKNSFGSKAAKLPRSKDEGACVSTSSKKSLYIKDSVNFGEVVDGPPTGRWSLANYST